MLARLKPAASRKTLLLTAASFWTAVGTLLLARGIISLASAGEYILCLIAVCLGTVKGLLVFRRSAEKNVARIQGKSDDSCLGAVFSFTSWSLIIFMIVLGRLLRLSGLSPRLYSLILVAVGWGLLLGSRSIWLEWKKLHA